MLTRLRAWLFPSFPDEDLNRRVFVVNLLALLALLLSVAVNASLIVGALDQPLSLFLAIGTLAVSLVWIGVIIGLARRGFARTGSHVLLWGGVALCLGSNWPDPSSGMRDPGWYLFALLVVAAGLLLGTRWGFVFAAVETVLYLGTGLAEIGGLIPRHDVEVPGNLVYLVTMVGGALWALAALAWLFGSGLERALRQARQRAAELQEAKGRLEQTQAYLAQTVERTVAEYTTFARQVAAGDLTSRLSLDEGERNPLMSLGQNLNAMVESLYRVSQQVHEAVQGINAVAAGIQDGCALQACGASEQATAIAQVSSTIAEVRTIAEQTADRAQSVAELAQRTAEVSQAGQQRVSDAVEGMGQVKERVEAIAGGILALSQQMETIGQIIATVNDIATRSKLLALNAAVEAARAGEAGRGFAVVAGEMRSLAERSRAATEQVRGIISEIQLGVDAAVAATQEGKRRADVGVQLTAEAGQSIQALSGSVEDSAEAAVQIAAAAGQQLIGVEQIAQAIEHIYQVMAQNLSSTRQAEQAAAELNALAGRLREIVAQYRL